jgi:signal transduction histidine kinase
MFRLDPQSVLLASGVLYASMPLTVWTLLHRRHERPNLELWCISGLLFSITFLLLGVQGQVPPWLGIGGANSVAYLGAMLKVGVLRMESALPPRWPALMSLWLATVLAQLLGVQMDPIVRVTATFATYTLIFGLLALAARQMAGLRRSRSGAIMSLLFAAFAAACLVRAVAVSLGLSEATPLSREPDFLLVVVFGLVSTIFANIGFMGLALDRARLTTREQQFAMDVLREKQQAMEGAARTREAVASERARTTRLLAHEVRQPLHNAAVALQSGVATLANSHDAVVAARAIEQAQAVIRRVSATLDNTVAATTMLAADGRISTADTDLQMLVDLCLGDLPPEARRRVKVDYRADARSARLEPSLVRLALRNLLMNATLYAAADTDVVLRVLDSDEPLAVVLEVADFGPGIADELRERIFDEGIRGAPATVPGYGLGLHVVKRVAKLHGGSIEWRPNAPCGSIFSLVLPQGDPG